MLNTIGSMKRIGERTPARYCYSVWLRHLVHLFRNGYRGFPERVVELGPGDSLGVGLCALLSGVRDFCALDVVRHVESESDRKYLADQFDDLVGLFEGRAPIPDNVEFPRIHPRLESHRFPRDILTDERLDTAMEGARLRRIRHELRRIDRDDSTMLRYVVPWDSGIGIEPGSRDLVLSQAVMEYVDDLETVYRQMYAWLKPGGMISHEIDFKSHGTAATWDGHWGYSSRMWKLVNGRSPCLITRYPHSHHVRAIRRAGFGVVCNHRARSRSELPREKVDDTLADLFDREDPTISSAFIQAAKPAR